MQTVPNIYIVNLAIGDLFLVVICVPFTATIYTFEEWPYGEAICKLNEFLQTVSVAVSVFTLVVLSHQRYKIIVRAVHYNSYDATKLRIIAAIWISAILLAVPDCVSSYVDDSVTTSTGQPIRICHPFARSWGKLYPKVHALIRFLLLFALPLLLISFYYVRVYRHLWGSEGKLVAT